MSLNSAEITISYLSEMNGIVFAQSEYIYYEKLHVSPFSGAVSG